MIKRATCICLSMILLMTGCTVRPNIAVTTEQASTERIDTEAVAPITEEVSEEISDEESNGINYDAETCVNAVLESENIWLQNLKDTMKESGDSGYCWFQDINMDGTPEFIVGGYTLGAHAAKNFKVYSISSGQLKPMVRSDSDIEEDNDLDFWRHGYIFSDPELSKNDFQGYLYADENGDYNFYAASIDGDGSGTYFCLDEVLVSDDTFRREERINITYGIIDYESGEVGWKANINLSEESMDTTQSIDEIKELYKKIFDGKTRRKSNNVTILCESDDADAQLYENMAEEEKRDALTASVNNCYSMALEIDENQEIPLISAIDDMVSWTSSQPSDSGNVEEDEFSLTEYLDTYSFVAPGVQDAFWEVYNFNSNGTYMKDIYSVNGEYISEGSEGTYSTTEDTLILDDGTFQYKYNYTTGSFFMDGDSWESRAYLEPLTDMGDLTEEHWQEILDFFYYDKDNLLDESHYRE